MDRLKKAIEQYPHWRALNLYVERIELARESNFPACIGAGKTLLESIAKEICKRRATDPGTSPTMAGVMKTAFKTLGLNKQDSMVQISTALATIAQNIGQIRNSIDTSAHGKVLADLDPQKAAINQYTSDFLVDSVDNVSVFLIHTYEHVRQDEENNEAEPDYLNFEEFNAQFDEEWGEVFIGDYSYQPSEVLFFVDRNAFDSEYAIYQATASSTEEE